MAVALSSSCRGPKRVADVVTRLRSSKTRTSSPRACPGAPNSLTRGSGEDQSRAIHGHRFTSRRKGFRLHAKPVLYSWFWTSLHSWPFSYEPAESQLAVVIPIALALILVLLVMTFGRVRPALLIFVNVPMAISGGIAGLALRGLPLSVSAAIGFIALFGVAVLNGLVLVSSIERLRDQGAAPWDAVMRGADARLRPVLTTAMVASLGFLPMALATGAGAEVQRPLATVVIGGLVSSMLVTLLVIPTVYAWLVRKEPDGAT